MRRKTHAEPEPPPEVKVEVIKVEALATSMEEIKDRASTKTALLTEILEHDTELLHITHWGINE